MGLLTNIPILCSLCLFCCGFLISFISYIVYLDKLDDNFLGGLPKSNKRWLWWCNINSLIVGCATCFIIFKNQTKGYRVAWSVYLGITFLWSIEIAKDYVYNGIKSGKAFGYGHLILSIIYFIWIFFFGCDGDTACGKLLNSGGDGSDA